MIGFIVAQAILTVAGGFYWCADLGTGRVPVQSLARKTQKVTYNFVS
jgi:hypothetical protein